MRPASCSVITSVAGSGKDDTSRWMAYDQSMGRGQGQQAGATVAARPSAGFPSLEQVEVSGVEQCLRWNRFLPSPRNDADVEIINAVVTHLSHLRSLDNDAYVAASKTIGWDIP